MNYLMKIIRTIQVLIFYTHISESETEIKTVQEIFGMEYGKVYEKANLLTEEVSKTKIRTKLNTS